jgi:hypothetical protein
VTGLVIAAVRVQLTTSLTYSRAPAVALPPDLIVTPDAHDDAYAVLWNAERWDAFDRGGGSARLSAADDNT